MLAHRVHCRDRRAGGEQGPVDRDLVVQRHTVRRRGKQRRPAARDQRDDEVVLREARHGFEQPFRCGEPCLVGDGMRRFQHRDAFAWCGIAVARHHHAFQRSIPGAFEGLGHLRRSLAGADDDGSPLRRFRQKGADRQRRVRGLHRGVVKGNEERLVIHGPAISRGGLRGNPSCLLGAGRWIRSGRPQRGFHRTAGDIGLGDRTVVAQRLEQEEFLGKA